MNKILLGCVLASVLNVASAETALVTWTDPIENVPDAHGVITPIPASGPGSLSGARIEYGSCSGAGFGTAAGEVVLTSHVNSGTISGLTPLTNYCYRVFVANTYGKESAASNVVAKISGAPTPRPPVISSVVAYTLRPSWFGIVRMVRVRGVQLTPGAACEAALPGLPGFCIVDGFIGRI